MKISRRDFVRNAAGGVNGLYLWLGGEPNAADALGDGADHFVLVDLGAGCALQESLLGYEAALGVRAAEVGEIESSRDCRLVIVPGVETMDSGVARRLSDLVKAGSALLLETGAGFSSVEEFASHREMLRDRFGIEVAPPVDVRGSSESQTGPTFAGYVEYMWPHGMLVRDFSRAVPVVEGRAEEVIGRVGKIPVAAKRRLGNGVVIFLGSPLGPALRGGDREARRWLRSLWAAAV